MLRLTTAAGERLEIPGGAIIAVMEPLDGANPSAIIFDMGAGPQVDQLSDDYGFVKRLAIDAMAVVNPIEVRERAPEGEGRMFFARDRIVGRREVKSGVADINSTLFVNLLGKVSPVHVSDTFDEMDGVEAPALPAVIATENAVIATLDPNVPAQTHLNRA